MALKVVALLVLVLAGTMQVQAGFDLANLTAGCDDSRGLDCGGRGQCISGLCECDPLWSKNTDFVELEECVTSYIGIYILWAINVLLIVHSCYKSIGVILIRIEVHQELVRTKRGYSLIQNKGLLAVLSYYLVSVPFHFIMSIAHFVDPTTRIGFDMLPSTCFFFAKLGFYVSIFFVQGSMFATTLHGIGSHGSSQRLIPFNYVFQFVVMVFTVVLGSLGFVNLVHFQNNVVGQVQLMQAYYLTQAFVLLTNAAGALALIRLVNRVFGRVKEMTSEKHDQVRKRVNDLQKSAFKQSALQGVIYLLMGCIPFFINKHQYFLPISWMTMPILGAKLALQFTSDRHGKTIMQRLGIAGKSASASDGPTNSATAGVAVVLHGSSFKLGQVHHFNPNQQTSSKQLATRNSELIVTAFSSAPQEFEFSNPGSPSVVASKEYVRAKSAFSSTETSSSAQLEELLDKKHPLNKEFVKFVEGRYAGNELDLLRVTLQYKQASTDKERLLLAKQAINLFIKDDSPNAVDIPSKLRSSLDRRATTGDWDRHAFDEIRRVLAFDLRGNFLSKFEELHGDSK